MKRLCCVATSNLRTQFLGARPLPRDGKKRRNESRIRLIRKYLPPRIDRVDIRMRMPPCSGAQARLANTRDSELMLFQGRSDRVTRPLLRRVTFSLLTLIILGFYLRREFSSRLDARAEPSALSLARFCPRLCGCPTLFREHTFPANLSYHGKTARLP